MRAQSWWLVFFFSLNNFLFPAYLPNAVCLSLENSAFLWSRKNISEYTKRVLIFWWQGFRDVPSFCLPLSTLYQPSWNCWLSKKRFTWVCFLLGSFFSFNHAQALLIFLEPWAACFFFLFGGPSLFVESRLLGPCGFVFVVFGLGVPN